MENNNGDLPDWDDVNDAFVYGFRYHHVSGSFFGLKYAQIGAVIGSSPFTVFSATVWFVFFGVTVAWFRKV